MRSDPSPPSGPLSGAVLEAAADWLDRQPDLSPGEAAEFEAWLAEDETHRRAYDKLRRVLGDPALTEAMAAVRAPASAAAKVLHLPQRKAGGARRAAPSWLAWGAGVAAVAAALAGVAVFVARPPAATAPAAAPAGVQAKDASVEYATNLAAPADARLQDRSVIHLDARSAVRVAFSPRARAVKLERGEAMFEVAHDPGRPFDVNAAGSVVTAVGTLFDVDLGGEAGGDLVDIRVYQGVVKVRPRNGETRFLRAGEEMSLDGAKAPMVRRFTPDLARTWRARWLDADDMPLGQAVDRLNRYAERPIVLRSGDLAAQPLSGSFDLRRTEATVTMLAALLDLDVTRDGRGVYLRRKH